MLNDRNTRVDILAIALMALTLFVAVSLFTYDRADRIGELVAPLDKLYQADVLIYPQNEKIQNACGFLGALTADVLYSSLGFAAFFVLAGMVAVGVTLIYRQKIIAIWSRTIGWVLALLGVATLCQLLAPDSTLGPIIGSGGYVGALTKGMLGMRFAFTGSIIVAIGLLVAGLFMWTDYLIVKWAMWMGVAAAAVFTYLVPIDWFRRESVDRQDGSDHAISHKPARNRQAADDLNSNKKTEVPTLRKSFFEEDEVEKTFTQDKKKAEPKLVEHSDWDEEKFDIMDDVEDVDAQPTNTIPFILKTAAKNALIPKMLRRKDSAEGDESIEENAMPTQTTLKGPHFSMKNSTSSTQQNPAQELDPRNEVIKSLNAAAEFEDDSDYQLPSIDLLTAADAVSVEEKRIEAVRKGKLLEQAFQNHGLKIKVVDFESGPVITQYELDLDPGLKLAKVTGLANDIAIALRVPSVRIVVPIPGKNTVGVEVPNDTRQTVRLREVIEDTQARTRKMKIPLFLGKDVAGDPMIADLASLPHLLIAGRTGTGKSVCLNAIITSILMTRRPDEVRMLMIDPKMVELSGYGSLPHLMHPVVTDMRKAEAILAWAVDKMEDRYRLLASAGVRHISSYNQLSEEEIYDRLQPQSEEERDAIPLNLPFIVIVADEMADLMMTSGKEVEQHIIRLAQKSRAVGIHLILATQKPTVDVITGLIKSNLPARISFQVASRTDSRVVLDEMGADKLLGNGDMLFLWPGTSTLLRGQGTFLSDEEIQSVTDAVSTTEQNFVHELINLKVENEGDTKTVGAIEERDELYHDAVEAVIKGERGSISLIQKNLSIGYGRAARLIDYMEEDGIVGTYNGSKSREVLIGMNEWEQIKNGGAAVDSSKTPTVPPDVPYGAKLPKPKLIRKNPVPPAVPRVRAGQSAHLKPRVIESDQLDEDVIDHGLTSELDTDDEPRTRVRPAFSVVRHSDARAELHDNEIITTDDEVEDDFEEEFEDEFQADGEEEDDVKEGNEVEADEDEDVEYEYEYVDEDDLEEGEEFEIEYQYVDEDDSEDLEDEK